MIKAVIFDIDGVLIDSLESNWKFFRDLLASAGYKKLPTKSDYKKAFHMTALDTIKFLTRADKKEIDRLMNIVLSRVHLQKLKIVPGSSKVVSKLAKKYKMALVTARLKGGVEAYLRQSSTKKHFKVVVHFGHFKNPKPSPESLLIACRRLKVQPSEAVYIGDALSDVKAAKAAKMKIIAYPKKVPGADAYTTKFEEIPNLISRINA